MNRRRDYDYFLGLRIKVTTFWIVLIPVVVVVPSLTAHLPLVFGYSVAVGVICGVLGLIMTLVIALGIAHYVARQEDTKDEDQTPYSQVGP